MISTAPTAPPNTHIRSVTKNRFGCFVSTVLIHFWLPTELLTICFQPCASVSGWCAARVNIKFFLKNTHPLAFYSCDDASSERAKALRSTWQRFNNSEYSQKSTKVVICGSEGRRYNGRMKDKWLIYPTAALGLFTRCSYYVGVNKSSRFCTVLFRFVTSDLHCQPASHCNRTETMESYRQLCLISTAYSSGLNIGNLYSSVYRVCQVQKRNIACDSKWLSRDRKRYRQTPLTLQRGERQILQADMEWIWK